jgi:hypothetical protein
MGCPAIRFRTSLFERFPARCGGRSPRAQWEDALAVAQVRSPAAESYPVHSWSPTVAPKPHPHARSQLREDRRINGIDAFEICERLRKVEPMAVAWCRRFDTSKEDGRTLRQ